MASDTAIYSVSEINAAVKYLLEGAEFLQELEIRGEISNIRYQRSGHVYFSLKDEDSQISCVMFKWMAQHLNFKLEDGMQVVLRGAINVYQPRGTYQINVKSIKREGQGDLYLKFLELKEKLQKEGLFDNKMVLPSLPDTIGIVSSASGSVIHDMISTIERRFPAAKILLSPALVQGASAARDMIRALDLLSNQKEVELVIIGRGGGSLEDLWCFNDENLVRQLAKLTTPTISAVGHETDFTLCDFACDYRAETPTAAAEKAYPDQGEWLASLDFYEAELSASLLKRVEEFWQRLDDINNLIEEQMLWSIHNKNQSLSVLEAKLESTDLHSLLSQGFSLSFHKGKRLNSSEKIEPGDELETVLAKGSISSVVKEIKK